jgi:hypothetical protein
MISQRATSSFPNTLKNEQEPTNSLLLKMVNLLILLSKKHQTQLQTISTVTSSLESLNNYTKAKTYLFRSTIASTKNGIHQIITNY